MLPDLTNQDIMLLKCFHLLRPEGKRDLLDYLRFIAQKQYRAELSSQVLSNPLLYNGLLQAARMCEREEIQTEDILQKISQLKYMYYNLLEKTRFKYDEALESNLEDIIRDWGRIGFENLTEAAQNGRKDLMLQELDEMIDSLEALTRKGDKKRFVAV
ncbi:MAG: hypothetical protein ACOX4Q_04410 [Syntrophomonadales bacterium]